MKVVNGRDVAPVATHRLQGVSNYFVGNDRTKWRSGIPHFRDVRYEHIYPGIDLVYHSNDENQPEYDFEVSAGVDLSQIELRFDGMSSVEVTNDGDLNFLLSKGVIRQKKPVAYQGSRILQARYILRGTSTVGFEVVDYDPAKPVVIDPIIEFSGRVGRDLKDVGNWIGTDADGNVYLAGGSQGPLAEYSHNIVFASKVNKEGTAILFTTYLGGTGAEFDSISQGAPDGSGGLYIAGSTNSKDFPIAGERHTVYGGQNDAFLARLSSTGALLRSEYIGNAGSDDISAITISPSGDLYAIGFTNSTELGGVSNPNRVAPYDLPFLLCYSPTGAIKKAKFLIEGSPRRAGIAVDVAGNVYLGGSAKRGTLRHDGSWQLPGDTENSDGYVMRLDPQWNATFGAYYGGSESEEVTGFSFDPRTQDVFLAGVTRSPDLPLEAAWLKDFNKGNNSIPRTQTDAFIVRISTTKKSLVYATYVGGSYLEYYSVLAVDSAGNAHMAGWTYSSDFPIDSSSLRSIEDANGIGAGYLVKLSPSGQPLVSVTHSTAISNSIAVDTTGDVYLAGVAYAWEIISTLPGNEPQGDTDAFFMKLKMTCDMQLSASVIHVPPEGGTFTVLLKSSSPSCGLRVTSKDWYIRLLDSSPTEVKVRIPPFTSSDLRVGELDVNGHITKFHQVGTNSGTPDTGVASSSSPMSLAQNLTAYFASMGYGKPAVVGYILINSTISSSNACMLEYQPAGNHFRLLSKDQKQWLGPARVGVTATLSNGNCTLDLKQSTVKLNPRYGQLIAVTANVRFDPSFGGVKNVYTLANAQDGSSSGWMESASLAIPAISLPGVQMLTPLNTGSRSNTYTGIFTHTGGPNAHYLGYILLLPTPNLVAYNATGTCLIEYNRISHGMRLIDDAGTGWLGPVSGVPIGPNAGSLSNSQCTINVAGSLAVLDGTRMVVQVPVTLKSGVGGLMATFLQGFDVTGKYTGMTQFGNAYVDGGDHPRAVFIRNGGMSFTSGSSVVLNAELNNLPYSMIHVRVGETIMDPAACHVIYFPPSRSVNLVADSGLTLVSPINVPIGPGGTSLSNSRCTVSPSGVSVTQSGVILSLGIPVTFDMTFAGQKYIYWNAFDNAGQTTHWVTTGTWPMPQ